MTMVDEYFQFIEERHSIYLRRFVYKDPYPWTADPVLKEYKFTNVFRELDTGTIYCRQHIREPYADHPELFFNIAMYRLFNWIGTYDNIGFVEQFDQAYVNSVVRGMREQGKQIFTGAHMITGTLGGDKIHQIVDICLTALWEHRKELEPQPDDTLEIAFKRLKSKSPGYGPFIAYEVITDLRHTRYLCDAADIMTWANPGPGAMRGINRIALYPVKPNKQFSIEYYLEMMQWLLKVSSGYMAQWMPKMEMRDIEHTLCEFDKYQRAKLDQGRPRSRFIPPHMRKAAVQV